MAEEKNYSIIGKVEIGTDEYRDLVQGLTKAEADVDAYRTKYWNEQSQKEKLEKELKTVKEKAANYIQFINENNLVDKFKLWKLEKEEEEE